MIILLALITINLPIAAVGCNIQGRVSTASQANLTVGMCSAAAGSELSAEFEPYAPPAHPDMPPACTFSGHATSTL